MEQFKSNIESGANVHYFFVHAGFSFVLSTGFIRSSAAFISGLAMLRLLLDMRADSADIVQLIFDWVQFVLRYGLSDFLNQLVEREYRNRFTLTPSILFSLE